ncbi:uncharacterized protein NMK_2047 [Novimethylophilus kurashikiensis]|uniref:Uncharacterized protein n=1 Tax=Novimethylophilus kurashikiensis TaxID=1825523 RepID=A0A2R5FA78_9PROT|nr:hypothetical protein [Novimethylophilus kurashikiensis]GBG14448.1 uncharacterized protein NMK_2047 [Novimethylophilus kurashikiensis]
MKKLAFLVLALFAGGASAATSSLTSWTGATKSVTVAPAIITNSLKPLVVSSINTSKPLQAAYAGTAKASFGFTEDTGYRNGYQTSYFNTASATGKVNLTATMSANASVANFTGTFSGFTPDAVTLVDAPKDFNQKAVATVLPASVPFTGTIAGNTVSGTAGSRVGVYDATQFYSPQNLTRTKDALPNSISLNVDVMSPRVYYPQGNGGYQVLTSVNYSGTATRK